LDIPHRKLLQLTDIIYVILLPMLSEETYE